MPAEHVFYVIYCVILQSIKDQNIQLFFLCLLLFINKSLWCQRSLTAGQVSKNFKNSNAWFTFNILNWRHYSESSIEAQAEVKFTEPAHLFSPSAFKSYDLTGEIVTILEIYS